MRYVNIWSKIDQKNLESILNDKEPSATLMLKKDGSIESYDNNFLNLYEIPEDVSIVGEKIDRIMIEKEEWQTFLSMINSLTQEDEEICGLGHALDIRKWIGVKAKLKKSRIILEIYLIEENPESRELLRHYDILTMLPNRTCFEDHVSSLETLKSYILIDLKRFHLINSNFGSKVGDKVLFEVSQRLQSISNYTIPLYRVGGNQYMLIVTEDDLHKILVEIDSAIAWPITHNGHNFYVNCYLGVYHSNSLEDNQKSLYYAEDAIWYGKKGKKKISYYKNNVSTSGILELEHDLRDALLRDPDQFEMRYQLQRDIINDKVCGAEALLRWKHPKRGYVDVQRFLALAQDLGMLPEIDKLVFNKVIEDLEILKEYGYDWKVSINLSAQSVLNKEFKEYLITVLEELKPNVSFEITETEWVEPEKSQFFLEKLKHMGHSISIDDFGAGYSTFEYILNYPADFIKIDKMFIQGISTNKKNQTIVSNIIKMSNGLGMKVIAEGVETKEDLNVMRSFGCHIVQGYYYAKPESLQTFIEAKAQKVS